MPELPEVETLRWPVPVDLSRRLHGEEVLGIRRRGKYLLIDLRRGHLLVHLGMSGRLSVVPDDTPPKTHDHVDVLLEGQRSLRLTDPRRFGAVLWLPEPAEAHALLAGLGLEPLEPGFTGAALRDRARGRRVAVKQFLMNGRIVVGVGNIYASEALWRAKIHPLRSAARISLAAWTKLAAAVRETLEQALSKGGSTLRDFAAVDGRAGRYQKRFSVYGREGKPCPRCGTKIRAIRQGQRSTFFCPKCQR